MKLNSQPATPASSNTDRPSASLNLLKRIRLEFLDDYSCEKRGYDPYDTSRGRKPDLWSKKHKRA